LPKRNDEYLNKFNPYITQVWRANTDIAAVTSMQLLTAYLTKYIAKAEKPSTAMIEVLQDILDDCPDHESIRRPIQRLFIKSCAERDYSSQEVEHLIRSHKLYCSSRQFIYVNLSKDQNQWIPLLGDAHQENAEFPKKDKKLIERYKERPQDLEALSLCELATSYNQKTYQKLSKKKIAVIFPRYYNKDNILTEHYCRQQIFLHHPWRDEMAFLQTYPSWKEAYIALNVPQPEPLTLATSNAAPSPDDISESKSEDEDTINRRETWMILSKLGTKNNPGQ